MCNLLLSIYLFSCYYSSMQFWKPLVGVTLLGFVVYNLESNKTLWKNFLNLSYEKIKWKFKCLQILGNTLWHGSKQICTLVSFCLNYRNILLYRHIRQTICITCLLDVHCNISVFNLIPCLTVALKIVRSSLKLCVLQLIVFINFFITTRVNKYEENNI